MAVVSDALSEITSCFASFYYSIVAAVKYTCTVTFHHKAKLLFKLRKEKIQYKYNTIAVYNNQAVPAFSNTPAHVNELCAL